MYQDIMPYAPPETEEARFARIWRRVMPQDRADCPFTLYEDAVPAIAPMGTSAPTYDILPARADNFAETLQTLIANELADAQTYRMLSRQAGGRAGRMLSAMAADELRHAKKLSVAHFLHTGVQLQPDPPPRRMMPMEDFRSALRRRFHEERRGEGRFRELAEEAREEELRELFGELAEGERGHAGAIREILEEL